MKPNSSEPTISTQLGQILSAAFMSGESDDRIQRTFRILAARVQSKLNEEQGRVELSTFALDDSAFVSSILEQRHIAELFAWSYSQLTSKLQSVRLSYRDNTPDDHIHLLFLQSFPLQDVGLCFGRALTQILEVRKESNEGEFLSTKDSEFRQYSRERSEGFRLLMLVFQRAVDNFSTFYTRFLNDRDLISQTFCSGSDPIVQRMSLLDAEPHQRGSNIFRVTLGKRIDLVYKPRSVDALFFFYDLCKKIRNSRPEFALPHLQVLPRCSYGWVEYLPGTTYDDPEKLSGYYDTYGVLVALVWLLGGTDIHHENLIAHDGSPYLIDVETLFHPLAIDTFKNSHHRSSVFKGSVISTMMTPWLSGSGVADASALGAPLDPRKLFKVDCNQYPEAANSKFAYFSTFPSGQSKHLPYTDTSTQNWILFIDRMVASFERFLTAILVDVSLRRLLASEVSTCDDFPIRVVARNTIDYADMLWASCHPKLLGSFSDRYAFLFFALRSGPGRFLPDKLLYSEIDQMIALDYPIFLTSIDQTNISDPTGTVIGRTASVGRDSVCKRISTLAHEEIVKQSWLFKTTVRIAAASEDPDLHLQRLSPPSVSSASLGRDLRLRCIHAIARLLRELCFTQSGNFTWPSINKKEDGHYGLTEHDISLYSGSSGILLFFSFYNSLFECRWCRELVENASSGLADVVDSDLSRELPLGVFNGLAGIAYVLNQLGVKLGNTSLLRIAFRTCEKIFTAPGDCEGSDLIGGKAGIIGIAHKLGLGRLAESSNMQKEYIQYLRKLCAFDSSADEQSMGRVLPGFAHGLSGHIWALTQAAGRGISLGEVSSLIETLTKLEQKIPHPGLKAAEDGFSEHANGTFDTIVETWCYGASGKGLARLEALRAGHLKCEKEIARLLDQTRKGEHFGSLSICHGQAGRIEFLLTAAQTLGDSKLEASAVESSKKLAALVDGGWYGADIKPGIMVPSLMNGMAGIGLTLLRSIDVISVASVATLEVGAGMNAPSP